MMQDDLIVVAASGFSHVLKLRVLRELSSGKASPSELSERTGERLGNVSYHVRQLHAAGFLGRAGTRSVRGAVEHFYVVSDRGREQLALLRAATGELLAGMVQRFDDEGAHVGAQEQAA
jgi:DNA-binding MarR family transcriptional regulator